MKHAAKITGLLVLLAGLTALAGAAEDAEIRYFDRTKNEEKTIPKVSIQEESPSHLTFKVGTGKDQKVSALDLREVNYSPATGRLEYRRPLLEADKARKAAEADRKKQVKTAVDQFREAIPKLKTSPFAQRHLQYQLCELLAWNAEQDTETVDDAITELKTFVKDHAEGWQIVPAAQALARLQEKKGDLAGALKTFSDLEKLSGVPDEVRQQCGLLVVRSLLDNRKHAEAETKLAGLTKELPAASPQAQRVQVMLAECRAVAGKAEEAVKQLNQVLEKSADPDVRAMAHNTLGDCYRAKGSAADKEAALWEYLWVHAMYAQDRNEHARALYHLGQLFDEVRNDEPRAKQCREQLRDKDYAGTEFQRRALEDDRKREGK